MLCQLGVSLLAQHTRRKPREKCQKGWLLEMIYGLHPDNKLQKSPARLSDQGFKNQLFPFIRFK